MSSCGVRVRVRPYNKPNTYLTKYFRRFILPVIGVSFAVKLNEIWDTIKCEKRRNSSDISSKIVEKRLKACHNVVIRKEIRCATRGRTTFGNHVKLEVDDEELFFCCEHCTKGSYLRRQR